MLLHGREEITAKECAVPLPGLGGEKAAGRKNKLRLSQGYGPLVTIFFPFSLLNKNDVSHCSGCTRAAKSSGCSSVSSKLCSPPQARTEDMRPLLGVTLSAGPCSSRDPGCSSISQNHHPTALSST